MIAYIVEIWCDGCQVHFPKRIPHDDPNAVVQLARNLRAIAESAGWTIDGAAHWCPKCTRNRRSQCLAS